MSGETEDIRQPSTAPKPPAERRQRRHQVELLLIAGRSVAQVCDALAGEWQTSARTLAQDCGAVFRRWRAEDGRHAQLRRSRILRRLEELANRCQAEGDRSTEHAVLRTLAQVTGLLVPASVAQQVNIGLQVGTDSLKQLMARAEALEQAERIKPAQLVEVPVLEAPAAPAARVEVQP